MKFYKELSKVYDIVFPKDEETLKFLLKDLKGNSKVLDLACGTGTYAAALALKGHRVDAVDLGEEMIDVAKSKGGLYVNFVVGDMTRAREFFQREKYNLAYCIGNSVVHLKSKEKIQKFIEDIYGMLNDGGAFTIQIVNYDRVVEKNVKALPTIDRLDKGVRFVRNYNYKSEEDKVEFQTELFITKEGKQESYYNSVDLIALKKDELEGMMKKAGFADIKAYGSFNEAEFKEDSFALIIKGNKL